MKQPSVPLNCLEVALLWNRDKLIIGVPIYMYLNSTNLGYCLCHFIGISFCEDINEQNQNTGCESISVADVYLRDN